MNNLTLVFGIGGKKKNYIIRNVKEELGNEEVKQLMNKMIEKQIIQDDKGNIIDKIIGAKNVKTEVTEIELDK